MCISGFASGGEKANKEPGESSASGVRQAVETGNVAAGKQHVIFTDGNSTLMGG